MIIRIDSKPNVAEDGHYLIFGKNEDGKSVRIDASGFMNYAPMYRDGESEPFSGYSFSCLELPELKEDSIIRFYLPSKEPGLNNQDINYSTCYDKDSAKNTDYYIRLK